MTPRKIIRSYGTILLAHLLIVVSPIVASVHAFGANEETKTTNIPCSFEEWSACVLPAGSVAIGSLLESGTGYDTMVSSDPSALALGVRTAQVKWKLPLVGDDMFAVGLKYVWFSRRTLFSESVRQHFDRLEGRFLRPSIAWTSRLSKRLMLHTFWASGFGKTHAELSDYGKRRLWESKHGSDPFPGDQPSTSETTSSSSTNQQKPDSDENATFARRTMQVQSITGVTDNRFQITGEFEREHGQRIFVSTRFERTRLEELETFSVRATVAEQWTLDQFTLRIGGGPQYSMLSGRDLDGEDIKVAGMLPAADLAFYWVF